MTRSLCTDMYIWKRYLTGLFGLADRNITSRNDWKQEFDKFKIEIRANFLAVGLTKHWNNLPEQVVGSLFLGVFKAK